MDHQSLSVNLFLANDLTMMVELVMLVAMVIYGRRQYQSAAVALSVTYLSIAMAMVPRLILIL